EPPGGEVGHRGAGGDSRAFVDERDFAEVAARAEGRARLAADRHRDLARLDDVERRAAGALADHRLARLEAPLLERQRDALDLACVEVGEQPDLANDVGGSAWHGWRS